MLTPSELARYRRQIIIPEWGEAGQNRIKEAKVVVVGAGGLGSAVLLYLAAAGIGTIRILDSDRVEVGNLNRQVLHSDSFIGKKKVNSARQALKAVNPHVNVETISVKVKESNYLDLLDGYLIVDALDNLPARQLLNRAALQTGLPLFHGAVYGFEGRATTIVPGKTSCLRCLYRDTVSGEIPVAGVTPGVIGCIQATEVIKFILGVGDLLTDRLLIFDGLSMTFTEVDLRKDPSCPECGPGQTPGQRTGGSKRG